MGCVMEMGEGAWGFRCFGSGSEHLMHEGGQQYCSRDARTDRGVLRGLGPISPLNRCASGTQPRNHIVPDPHKFGESIVPGLCYCGVTWMIYI